MTSTSRPFPPIQFADTALRADCHHICAFFTAPEEEDPVIHPFVRDGIERGERGFHIVNPRRRSDYARRLERSGIDVDALAATGRLEIRTWDDAYLRDARFDPSAMLSLIQEILDRGHDEGFPLTRLVAHMEWALEDFPGVNDLIEYESRLNRILPEYDDPVICVYDPSRFDGGAVLDVLRTHPMVIVGGVLRENPFYVPPDEFLGELEGRDGGASLG